jgi:hypothetical protein
LELRRLACRKAKEDNKENEVKNNRSNKLCAVRASLVGLAVLAVCGAAFAQEAISTPATPDLITPPVGNSAFLSGHGVGTQGYVCLPNGSGGASWTVNGARPEATLFGSIFGEAVQIITHFLSPVENPNLIGPNPPRFGDVTWQSSFDSSRVWAQKEHFITAGTDPSCPNSGAIDCLLLQVIGTAEGPTGGKSLIKTTFIQRLNTKGGSAPATGCGVPGDVGKQTLVPYSADYFFFRDE